MKVVKKAQHAPVTMEDVIAMIKNSNGTPEGFPNFYFYGPVLCGKTRAAHEIARALGQDDCYNKAKSQYWRRYNGEKVVLIDDLKQDDGQYIQNYLLNWAKPYRFNVTVEGYKERVKNDDGRITFIEKDIKEERIDPTQYVLVLTSTKKPDAVFKFDLEDQERFEKLFNVIEITPDFFEKKDKRKSKADMEN